MAELFRSRDAMPIPAAHRRCDGIEE